MNRFQINLRSRNNLNKTASIWTLSLYLMTALLFYTGSVNASEEALYGPKAPPGSAFVRVFNNAQSALLTANVGGKTMTAEGAYGASAYEFLPAGEYTLSIKNIDHTLTLAADHYYTAYLDASGKISTVEGRAFNQRKKSLIVFYNLTEAPLTLKTENGKGTVIKDVASKTSGFREVNAVKIGLAAFNETAKVVSASPIVLKRGEIFSLFATSNPSAHPTLVWIQE